MSIAADQYEKLGTFYLGREYDPEAKEASGDLVLYDSKDLVTHGVVLGMTGSGKTGLCLALLEEAAIDRIPAIVIDPKGDIANLLLTFPDLQPGDFLPWVNADDAARKGVSAEELAAKTAETWRKGLADWGQEPQRIRDLRERVDVTVFTPGSKAGIPVSILSSLAVPPAGIMEDAELLGELVVNTVTSLLTLVGVADQPSESPEAVLLSSIFQQAWAAGQDLNLETLIRHIQRPAFDKVGVIDLESFMPEKSRQALALRFNNLLASPGFSAWLEGTPLDIARMLHGPGGKPRVSIFSIAHLDDADRMFFVSLLLNQTLGWMRTQGGTTSLRAIFYMDEIYGYLPPTENPPSKKPLMTMLKQARAFGLGCLLATQNPVDLDYKALSNIGTWWLGRLQTERDKLRVLDGLEGAAGAQNAKFDRGTMEKLLSGLGNRVFLMNNVHEDAPVLFHVRWVMSYLAGPVTRGQIKILMDPRRGEFGAGSDGTAGPQAPNLMAMPSAAGVGKAARGGGRPVVGAGVVEKFAKPAAGVDCVYQPCLLRVGTVHFASSKAGVEAARTVRSVNPVKPEGIDWDTSLPPPLKVEELGAQPAAGTGFGELPGFAMNAANYKQVEKDFAEWLYRNERMELWYCPAFKQWSKPGESEGEFRARLGLSAREARDAAVAKLREAARKKVDALQGRLQTAEATLARQQAEASSAKMQAGASVLGSVLGALLGRKSGLGGIVRSGAGSVGKASSAYKQQQDVTAAKGKVEGIERQLAELQQEVEQQVAELGQALDPLTVPLETESLKPTRTNVTVDTVALLWLPFDERGGQAW